MTDQPRCPECRSPVDPSTPGGLCPRCLLRRGLETNTLGTASADPASASWTPPTPEELAPRFPELDVLELIGRGGMGAVYKARQKNLDRLVALKILPPEIARDPAFADRFAREAQAMARLSHPHIVAIHDFGRRDDLYFFLMEYVDGLNLRQLITTGDVSPREALAIVPQICDALQFAHDRGIVHRDIKPENILIDRAGRVRIADFGLAKLVGQGTSAAGTPSAERVCGTPHYMAPEQVARPADVDHRADIYSLGVVFYQMLTGELPLGRFEPPSRKVLIDVRLDEVVLRALETEPARRYQQASHVATEVETILQTQAPPPRVSSSPASPDAPPAGAATPNAGASWPRRVMAAAAFLALATAVAAHLVGLAVTEGGATFFWGHDFAQRHLVAMHALWPGLMGALAACLLWVHLARSPMARSAVWIIGALTLLLLAWGLPLQAALWKRGDTLILVYALLITGLALPLWARLLDRWIGAGARSGRTPARVTSPGLAGRIVATAVLALGAVAMLASFFTNVFRVPRFVSLFADFGVSLPMLTRILIGFSGFTRHYWFLLAPPALLILLAVAFIIWKVEWRVGLVMALMILIPAAIYPVAAQLLLSRALTDILIKAGVVPSGATREMLLRDHLRTSPAVTPRPAPPVESSTSQSPSDLAWNFLLAWQADDPTRLDPFFSPDYIHEDHKPRHWEEVGSPGQWFLAWPVFRISPTVPPDLAVRFAGTVAAARAAPRQAQWNSEMESLVRLRSLADNDLVTVISLGESRGSVLLFWKKRNDRWQIVASVK